MKITYNIVLTRITLLLIINFHTYNCNNNNMFLIKSVNQNNKKKGLDSFT